MRSLKLLGITAAAAALLALAGPAGASAGARTAVKHSSPNGRCAVNINVEPGQITAGDPVVVWGRLRCHGRGSNVDAKTVTLLQRTASSGGFGVAQTILTDPHGFYEFNLTAVQNNTTLFVRSHGAASGHRTVTVAAQVTLNEPPDGTQLFTGPANKVTFTGTVNPADVGARLVLQRQNAVTGNEWRRIDTGRVGAGGTFSITHTFVVPGDANIRVLVRSRRRNLPSFSNVNAYEISQAENPNFTIEASPDPISYGQSVTITGTVSGADKAPVTLEARTARQHGYAPVAEVTTDASGNYSFPAQSPINSTFYQVKGAGKASAILYEGVKDVLTPEVTPPGTVAAGQPLTFSGKVSPDHSGHVIYLERQDASGTGFHVVKVGIVATGSTYSLVHRVYDAGTKVFRVKIPGGPENEGAASPPVTIVVTPVSASTLPAEAPGNSSMPSEGQS
jgi:hypothetical protein